MRKYSHLVVLLSLLAWGSLDAQQPPQEPTPPPQKPAPDQPAPTPAPVPRVVGKARTQDELNAYKTVAAAADFHEKIALGQSFLEQYPESGLTSFVHRELALAYQQLNDYDNFVAHAEKALAELPRDSAILTVLARGYAERGKSEKAIDRAQKGIAVLKEMKRPENVATADWIRERDRRLADAHYAWGFSLYRKAVRMTGPTDTVVKSSIEHFQKAVEEDPGFDAAYYRMANAYIKLNNAQDAMLNYARAVALNGIAASLARNRLQKVYKFVHKNTHGIKDLLKEQAEYVKAKQAEKESYIQQLVREEEERKQKVSPDLPPIPPQG